MTEPSACTHCDLPRQGHFQRWTREARWHQWTAPTQEQILARMKARRAARLAARGALDPDTIATITANAGQLYHQFAPGPPCIPDHGSGGWCPGCAYDPTES